MDRYYWIKLRTDFFNQANIDFILSQKNGCEYIVLYQMLCLQTANNNGELASRIGEMIIPYDAEKIVRDTKYFDYDTVTIALELFKRLGLIYECDSSGTLRIADYNMIVGTESANREAEKKRKYRAKLKDGDNIGDKMSPTIGDKMSDRDRYRERERDRYNIYVPTNVETKPEKKKFIKPTLEEIKAYCKERNNTVDAEKFFDFYEANGWVQGKGSKPIKDWKAAVRTWERSNFGNARVGNKLQATANEIDVYAEAMKNNPFMR